MNISNTMWAIGVVSLITGSMIFRTQSTVAQAPVAIGCNQGSGLFDLFDAGSDLPFIDEKIFGTNGPTSPTSRTLTNIRALSDPSDPNSPVQTVSISPGAYRIYAIAADDHFDFGHRGEPLIEDQAFESFYVKIDGQLSERPTPDRGLIGDGSFSAIHNGNTLTFQAAGFNLDDWNLYNGANGPFNNGIFDGDTDYLGQGKYQDQDETFQNSPLPVEFTDRSDPNFDIGADLGVLNVGSATTEVEFLHFFDSSLGNSAFDDGGARPATNPNGVEYPNFFSHQSHSAHVGIVRLQCLSDGAVDSEATPIVNVPVNAISLGGSAQIQFDACAGVGLGNNVVVSLEQSIQGGAFSEVQAEPPAELGPCPANPAGLDLDSSLTFTPVATQLGQTICFRTVVTPGATDDPDPRVSAEDCLTVTAAALFAVRGGDVVSFAGIDVLKNGSVGSNGQYRVQANEVIVGGSSNGFGSGNQTGGTELTFSNVGQNGNFSTATAADFPDYYGIFEQIAADEGASSQTTSVVNNGTINGLTNNSLDTYVMVDAPALSGVVNIGPITNYGGRVVLVVNGSVNITNNITVQLAGVSANELPVIAIVASGNITIAPGVDTVWASLIAGGNINSCSAASLAGCRDVVTVNGVTAAQGYLQLNRASTSLNSPSEIFDKPAYLDLLDVTNLDRGDVQITQFKDLPPVLR